MGVDKLTECIDTAYLCALHHSRKLAALGGVDSPLQFDTDSGFLDLGFRLSKAGGYDAFSHGNLIKYALYGLDNHYTKADYDRDAPIANIRMWSECSEAYADLTLSNLKEYQRLKTNAELDTLIQFGLYANTKLHQLHFEPSNTEPELSILKLVNWTI